MRYYFYLRINYLLWGTYEDLVEMSGSIAPGSLVWERSINKEKCSAKKNKL
jgi:hypothetical protein